MPGYKWRDFTATGVTRRRTLGAGVALALVGTLVAAAPASRDSAFTVRQPQKERSIDGTGVAADAKRAPGDSTRDANSPTNAPHWPAAGRQIVDLSAEGEPKPARPDAGSERRLIQTPGMPIKVAVAATSEKRGLQAAAAASRLEVHVTDRQAVRRAGLDGILLSIRRADGGAAAPDIHVEVDYKGFRSANGAGWSDRLRLVQFPACVLTTPEVRECRVGTPLTSRNDNIAGTLSADVQVAPDGAPAPTVLAATAGTAGGAGDFKATSLAPSGAWTGGGSAGGFGWSNPITLPPVPGSLTPGLSLGYSSSSVDGRTSATASQPSVVGEGWSGVEQGFIERRYRNCGDDKDTSGSTATKEGDWCWVGGQHVSVSLNGKSSDLVRDESSGTWRLSDDDGSRVEHLTGSATDTANGDDGDAVDGANEYWRVTTGDGTQYWFGKNRMPGWSAGKPETNSVYTAPVFGNNPGEPGYHSAFADSAKDQAWRWNLDFVTDVHGNASAYFYTKEQNYYSLFGARTGTGAYTRGGYLSRIEYGHRADRIYTDPAPARVDLTYAERCLADCDTFDKDHAANWPDVPVDLNCAKDETCYVASPTFWTRKRLTGIDTSVWSGSGTDYTPADGWALEQTFPGSGDRGGKAMWLASITHTGKAPGSAPITLPKTTFEGTLMANRVDGAEGLPPLYKYRLTRIGSETGTDTLVTYSPGDCTTADLPAPDANTRRCYPVWWTPEGQTEPLQDWFHTYVVTQVQDDDLVAGSGSPTMVTSYEYLDGAAWHRDEDEFTLEKHRTWNQFRGYGKVRVRKGAVNPTLNETVFFRGMDGDRLADGTARSVQVQGVTDRPEFSGRIREQTAYDKDIALGGTPAVSTVTEPVLVATTATRPRPTGLSALTANQVRSQSEIKKVRLEASRWQSTKTSRTFDADGQPITISNEGDTSIVGDESCSRTTFAAADRTAWLIGFPASEQHTSALCDVAATPANILAESRNYYDGRPLGQAPEPGKGNVTRQEGLERFAGSTPVFGVAATTTYDVYGRPLSVTGEDGQTNSTSYTPATGRSTSEISVTNPKGWTGRTTIDPIHGLTLKSVDVNGRGSASAFDALGRLTSVWLSGRPTTAPANMLYSYAPSQTAPTAVTTKTLLDDGTYHTEITLSDGFLRPRQVQSQVADGRVVTDTFYDDQGRKAKENAGFFNANAPEPALLSVADNQIPSQAVFEYDGMSRTTASVFKSLNVERWRTGNLYGGNWVATVPPAGGTSSLKITDVQGRPTELRQYKDTNPADGAPLPAFDAPPSAYDATRYSYDAAGNRTRVVDAAGSEWKYEFDLRGRQTKAIDPEQGVTSTTYVPGGQFGADQIETRTDPRGQTLAYTYDQLGRKTSQREGSPAGPPRAEWGYDLPGALGLSRSSTRIDNGLRYVSETTGYDPTGHPTGVKVTIPSAPGEEKLAGEYTTTSTFTPGIGLLDKVTYGQSWGGLPAETLDYGYTKFGLANTLTSGNTRYINGTVYSPFGEPTQTQFGNTGRRTIVSMSYAEDTRRLVRTVADREKSGPQTLDDLNYTYDPSGNIVRIVNKRDDATSTDTQCFAYDYRTRMTDAWSAIDDCAAGPATGTAPRVGGIDPYWTSYTFDAAGNRIAEKQHDPAGNTANDVTRTYNTQAHRLDSVDASGPGGTNRTSYAYDPAGNTTRRTVNGDDQNMTWDVEGRLASSSKTEAGQLKTSTFVYDPDGTRLLRREPDAVTLYLGTTELKLTRATNTVSGTRYYPGAGGQFLRTSTGRTSILVADHHGTSQLAVDYASMTYTRRPSMPYGDARGVQPSVWPDDKGFLGAPKDSSTGLTHVGAREYDPSIGRFMSRDPLTIAEDPAQLHPYMYGGGNPVNISDPSGMGWGRFFKKAVKVAAVAVVVAVVVTVVVAAPVMVPAAVGASGMLAAGAAGAELGLTAAAIYVGTEALDEARKPSSSDTDTDDKCKKNSFAGETPVLLADGTTKPIEQITVGDKVAAADPERPEHRVPDLVPSESVSAVHVTDDDTSFVDVTIDTPEGPRAITSTADHRFYSTTKQAWVKAVDLKPGEEVQTPTGRTKILASRAYTAVMRTYNLTVDRIHTYFVGARGSSVLVHNESTGGCPHVVLGIGKFSDTLAWDHRAGKSDPTNALEKPSPEARTYNQSFRAPGADNSRSGDQIGRERPAWMDSVEKAIYDNSTRLSITLEGLPGNTPREKFHNAAVKGLWAKLYPDKNGWETPASPGFGTAWEMYTVFEAALENKRVWGEIEWFDGDGKGNRWKVPNRDMGPAPDDSWEDRIYKDYRDIKDGIKEVDWIF
ncbi:RHS repeat-associated core domain-containing protein [Embleya sp. NPDC059237]|uniref:RHS repeat-associated core domain-containing protein n=1 Tax=Embleya sp. NPDC059237 TaxID=3346784 RepID=UPI00369D9EE3